MQKQPLLILCSFFILGVISQEYLNLGLQVLLFLLGFLCCFLLLMLTSKLWILRLRHPLFFSSFFVFGMVLHFFQTHKPDFYELNLGQDFVFKNVNKLNSNEKNRRYEVAVVVNGKFQKAVLSIPRNIEELDFLHYYKGQGKIFETAPPEQDYQFDYAKYVARKGIFLQGYIYEISEVNKRTDLSFTEKISQKRLEILEKIETSELSPKSVEFVKGIVLADRTEMDSDTIQDFSVTGMAHLLAISGSHFAIIYGFIYGLLHYFSPIPYRKYAIVFSIVIIWAFATFIGFGSSVVRACIMLTCYQGFLLLQRTPDLLHALALSAFVIVVFDSQQVFQAGFQLSFVAVLGIFWLNKPLQKYIPKPKTFLVRFFQNVLTMTLAAQIATLPLVLFYFHQFSFISILANVLLIPLAEIIIIISFLLVFIIVIKIPFSFVIKSFDFLISKFLLAVHWFSQFNSLFFEDIPIFLIEVLLLFLAIYFFRDFFIKLKYKYTIRFLAAILLFLTVRVALNYYFWTQVEVVKHKFYKENVYSVKESGKVYFLVSKNVDEKKLRRYIIHPYLVSRRSQAFQIQKFKTIPKTMRWKGQTIRFE